MSISLRVKSVKEEVMESVHQVQLANTSQSLSIVDACRRNRCSIDTCVGS